MSGGVLKLLDSSHSQETFKKEMKILTNERKEKLQNSIFQTLDGRLPKSDSVTEETHETKFSIHDKHISNSN